MMVLKTLIFPRNEPKTGSTGLGAKYPGEVKRRKKETTK